MAKNESRSMAAELQQGIIDGRYMQLAPNWNTEANLPTERMDWPTYSQVERHQEQNVRQVPTVDAEIVKVNKARHAGDLLAHPQGTVRHTQVDTGAYQFGHWD